MMISFILVRGILNFNWKPYNTYKIIDDDFISDFKISSNNTKLDPTTEDDSIKGSTTLIEKFFWG